MRVCANMHSSAQDRGGRYVRAHTDHAIVFDHTRSVKNRAVEDARACLHHGARADEDTSAQRCGRRKHSTWINDGGKRDRTKARHPTRADRSITDRRDESHSVTNQRVDARSSRAIGIANERERVQWRAHARRLCRRNSNQYKSRALRRLCHHCGVTARTKNEELRR